MKKITEQDKILKIQANQLKQQQKGKSNIQILEELDNKSNEKLLEGIIKVNEFFGIPGIYFLFNQTKLVYIGESSCIFTRLSQHFKNENKEFDSFKYEIFTGDIKDRKKKEEKLIKRFRPILNFIHNPSLRLN